MVGLLKGPTRGSHVEQPRSNAAFLAATHVAGKPGTRRCGAGPGAGGYAAGEGRQWPGCFVGLRAAGAGARPRHRAGTAAAAGGVRIHQLRLGRRRNRARPGLPRQTRRHGRGRGRGRHRHPGAQSRTDQRTRRQLRARLGHLQPGRARRHRHPALRHRARPVRGRDAVAVGHAGELRRRRHALGQLAVVRGNRARRRPEGARQQGLRARDDAQPRLHLRSAGQGPFKGRTAAGHGPDETRSRRGRSARRHRLPHRRPQALRRLLPLHSPRARRTASRRPPADAARRRRSGPAHRLPGR